MLTITLLRRPVYPSDLNRELLTYFTLFVSPTILLGIRLRHHTHLPSSWAFVFLLRTTICLTFFYTETHTYTKFAFIHWYVFFYSLFPQTQVFQCTWYHILPRLLKTLIIFILHSSLPSSNFLSPEVLLCHRIILNLRTITIFCRLFFTFSLMIKYLYLKR